MQSTQPSLPANRTFVVQFRLAEAKGRALFTGRVEHLVSGQASHFQSWAELQEFIAQVLAEREVEKPP
jgi:hypothetical protein